MAFRNWGLGACLKGAGLLALALVALTWAMTAASHQAGAKAPEPGYSILYSFCHQNDCTDGSQPSSGVTVTSAGTIFGSTCKGGTNQVGILFSLTKKGVFTPQVQLDLDTTGACPDEATLLAKSSTEFFGTAAFEGADDCGTVFALKQQGSKWVFQLLYSFTLNDDGCGPSGGLVMDKKGNLYGTTNTGGVEDRGTVFELSPPAKSGGAWTETILYEFCSADDCTDGSQPTGTLIMDKTGTLYGTTEGGGTENGGTIFAIPPYGGEAVLYSFCQLEDCTDGEGPAGNLAIDASGNLYGTT